MATKIQRQFKKYIFRKKIFLKLKELVKRKNIWRKFEKKWRIKILKQAKNVMIQYADYKKKMEQ